ncbi:Transcription antitermination protein nusG [Mycoplasmopsis californica]|uniref:Transcription termination/antitermination protein NusG n=1 Tax=Mycoplasmopsis equigenitalium TaxID=114883 RepID=A0ABY5J0M5_9BACT|nr:transcription termination/antitermination protein NusG [Mycoplasmopsis equigenitalium]UUD36812.1 transcription termination/antitermination protein NusG [Mycoplasmopsis equigenitalium]VEU69890.1 Transcription antitermination protein nusG [Mycoplasmopsis californica]
METQWYMVSTMTGKEDKVYESLQNRIVSEGIDDVIEAIHIFKEPRITKKELEKRDRGEEYKVKMANMYSGYIFIKMEMTDKAWFVIRNTQYVTGLIGSSGKGAKPTPVSPKEMERMFNKEREINDNFAKGIITSPFIVGAYVEIISGPFEGQQMKITKCDNVLKKVTGNVEIFGKLQPQEFDFSQIKLTE